MIDTFNICILNSGLMTHQIEHVSFFFFFLSFVQFSA